MEPRRQERSSELVKNQKKRFQIVKLEERVAPSRHGGGSGTLSGGSASVQSRG
jgi:hypothetical protein